jgi:uncharacterized protein YcgL (UPF0745 family)
MTLPCRVYRCSKQDEMYLYLREGFKPEDLPPPLLQHVGRLTEVMKLELTPQRKLARADAAAVAAKLRETGYYLQLPPDGHIKAHLHFGD